MRIWKEVVMIYLKMLFKHFPSVFKNNDENPQVSIVTILPTFEMETSPI
jgi:hypothetical protein